MNATTGVVNVVADVVAAAVAVATIVVVVIENGLALIRLGIFFAFRNHHRRRNCVRELTHKKATLSLL